MDLMQDRIDGDLLILLLPEKAGLKINYLPVLSKTLIRAGSRLLSRGRTNASPIISLVSAGIGIALCHNLYST